MFNLISTINVGEVDTFIEGAKSAPQEHLAQFGVIKQSVDRGVDQNVVIITNTYKTLEEAQKHKTILESPEMEAQFKQMGVDSFDMWLAERIVSR